MLDIVSGRPRKQSRIDERYVALIGTLRSARLSQGLSQGELAALIGREQTFVSKFELRDRRLDVIELIDICNALQLVASQLLARFEQGSPDFEVGDH